MLPSPAVSVVEMRDDPEDGTRAPTARALRAHGEHPGPPIAYGAQGRFPRGSDCFHAAPTPSTDLLGGGLDHPRLVEAQALEGHGIFGVVLAPAGVRYSRMACTMKLRWDAAANPLSTYSRPTCSASLAQSPLALRIARRARSSPQQGAESPHPKWRQATRGYPTDQQAPRDVTPPSSQPAPRRRRCGLAQVLRICSVL